MPPDQTTQLEVECARHLSPDWAGYFSTFMATSTLGTARLFAWAEAFLAATPPSEPLSKRYALHETTLSKWIRMLHGDDLAGQRQRTQALNEHSGLHFVVTYFSLSGTRIGVKKATLIVVFERQTETLAHHIIRIPICPESIWYVIAETRRLALAKYEVPPSDGVPCSIESPAASETAAMWRKVCSYLAEHGNQFQDGDAKPKQKRMYIDWGISRIRLNLAQWRTVETHASIPFHELDIGDDDINGIHRLLQTAASAVTAHFAEQPRRNGYKRTPASWVALSRTRTLAIKTIRADDGADHPVV